MDSRAASIAEATRTHCQQGTDTGWRAVRRDYRSPGSLVQKTTLPERRVPVYWSRRHGGRVTMSQPTGSIRVHEDLSPQGLVNRCKEDLRRLAVHTGAFEPGSISMPNRLMT